MGGFLPDVNVTRDAFSQHKQQAAKAAKDLLYGDEIVESVKAAKSSEEINRIMKRAREKKFG